MSGGSNILKRRSEHICRGSSLPDGDAFYAIDDAAADYVRRLLR